MTNVAEVQYSHRLLWLIWQVIMMYVMEVIGLDYFSDFFFFDNITVLSIHHAYNNKAPLYWTETICHHGNPPQVLW